MEASPLFNKPPAGHLRRPLLAPDDLQSPSLDAGLRPHPMELPHVRSSASGSRRNTPKQLRPPSAPSRRPSGEPVKDEVRAAGSCAPVSFFNFIGHQLLIGVDESVTAEMEDESARKRRKGVYHFLQAPWELEKLLILGYCVCLDSFLFMVTMLPLRLGRALLSAGAGKRLSWLQICDVMCVGAILIAVLALGQIDTSQAYHAVKGQAVIKLYVVFNVLEVFDKLCASFGQVSQAGGRCLPQRCARGRSVSWAAVRNATACPTLSVSHSLSLSVRFRSLSLACAPGGTRAAQDILHTLFWSSMARRTWRGHLLLDFLIVAVYLVVHSYVLFYQVCNHVHSHAITCSSGVPMQWYAIASSIHSLQSM
jgi:hypothetical protein